FPLFASVLFLSSQSRVLSFGELLIEQKVTEKTEMKEINPIEISLSVSSVCFCSLPFCPKQSPEPQRTLKRTGCNREHRDDAINTTQFFPLFPLFASVLFLSSQSRDLSFRERLIEQKVTEKTEMEEINPIEISLSVSSVCFCSLPFCPKQSPEPQRALN